MKTKNFKKVDNVVSFRGQLQLWFKGYSHSAMFLISDQLSSIAIACKSISILTMVFDYFCWRKKNQNIVKD